MILICSTNTASISICASKKSLGLLKDIIQAGIEGLPARLIAVYTPWKDGVDLRVLYPKASFYRYRSEFLKQGIDIAIRQSSKPDNVFSLVRVLRPEAIVQVPDWAIGTKLYFNQKNRLNDLAVILIADYT